MVKSMEVDPADEEESLLEQLEKEERKRAYQQIMGARGYLDLRSVESTDLALEGKEEIDAARRVVDAGGEDGLIGVKDKALLRRQRTFVVKMKGGIAVRFEVNFLPRWFLARSYPTDAMSRNRSASPSPSATNGSAASMLSSPTGLDENALTP